MSLNIGIVGATGYVGEELASIIESREDLSLAFVSSFSHEGKTVSYTHLRAHET